jgi:hypothetical protein
VVGRVFGAVGSTTVRGVRIPVAVHVLPRERQGDTWHASYHDAGRYLDYRENHDVFDVGLSIYAEQGGTNGAENDGDESKSIDAINGQAESPFLDSNEGGKW